MARSTRGNLPLRIRPACVPTPISVPIVSNTSMNKNMMTTGIIGPVSAAAMSIRRNVGPSDGGTATRPSANLNCVASNDPASAGESAMPVGSSGITALKIKVAASAAAMPHMIEPTTRRACSTAPVRNPMRNTSVSGEARTGFNRTAVAGSAQTSCPLRSPMNAMNRPMPTAIPCFMLGLTVSSNCLRTPRSDNNRKSIPATKTAPSAALHGSATPAAAATGMAVTTKKKFWPIPGASAMGYRANSPMTAVANAAARHVAVVTAPASMPVSIPNIDPDSTAGCTKMM